MPKGQHARGARPPGSIHRIFDELAGRQALVWLARGEAVRGVAGIIEGSQGAAGCVTVPRRWVAGEQGWTPSPQVAVVFNLADVLLIEAPAESLEEARAALGPTPAAPSDAPAPPPDDQRVIVPAVMVPRGL